MIHLKIGKNKATLAERWNEVTIRQAIELGRLGEPKQTNDYRQKVFRLFCKGCPEGGTLSPAIVELYYKSVLEGLVNDLQTMQPEHYTLKGIKSFEFEGETFLMPANLVINDGFIPAYDEKAAVFAEAGDLLNTMIQGKTLDLLPALAATYCRKQGEQYSDKLQLERAERFEGLTMDIGWEVFFWAVRSTGTLLRDLVSHIQRQVKRRGWPLRLQDLRAWATGQLSIR